MDSRQDPDRQVPAPRPPWEPAQAQYRAVWQLDARRKTRRSRWLAVVGAAALVLIAGAWVGYLAGSGDGGWQEAAAPFPVPSTSPADTYSPGPDATMAERLDTTVLEGGSDLLATTVVRAHPAPAVCPPSSDPDQPGPTGQPRPDPTGSYGWRAAFHEPSGRVILLDTSVPSDPRAWAFDVCRNTWSALAAPPRELGSIDDLVFDADSGLMAAFPASGRPAWTLNVDTGAWVRVADHQGAALPVERAPRVYDPGTGLIVGRADTGEVTALDVESGERALVRQVGEVPLGYGQLVYHATADEIVLIQPVLLGTQGHRVAIWRLNPRSGRWTYDWSPSGAPLAVPWPPAIAHDAASGVTVVAGQTIELAGQGARVTEVIGYEPGYIERMYIGTDDGIAHCATRAIVYDTVNNRVVCVGGVRYSFDPRGRLVGISDVTDVTAFDVTRRTWVRLQEP